MKFYEKHQTLFQNLKNVEIDKSGYATIDLDISKDDSNSRSTKNPAKLRSLNKKISSINGKTSDSKSKPNSP